jgi:hypothetical protein
MPKRWYAAYERGRPGYPPKRWSSLARLPNPQTVDAEGLVAFFASMGWIDGLPDEARLPLLDQIRSLLTAAEYRLSWETHVHWTRLPPE